MSFLTTKAKAFPDSIKYSYGYASNEKKAVPEYARKMYLIKLKMKKISYHYQRIAFPRA